jgi:hypothetical protein
MNSWAPISGFVRPSAARRAICHSCAVSSSTTSTVRLAHGLARGLQLPASALGAAVALDRVYGRGRQISDRMHLGAAPAEGQHVLHADRRVQDPVGLRACAVTAVKRVRPVSLGAEVAFASGAGVAMFALVAVTVAAIDSEVLVVAFGLACVLAVVAIVHSWGVALAVPAAMTGLVAFDWFQFPPTHRLELPSSGDLASLLMYVTVAVVVGEAAAVAGRRAQVSEVAHGELA